MASSWSRSSSPATTSTASSAAPAPLEVSAHCRMERLLRQSGVPARPLSNRRTLVVAPRRERSGWLDLQVADIVITRGRPIVAALRLLLSETRLLSLPRDKRFAALLADSRRLENELRERLAEQVPHILYELLRGVQAPDEASDRELLREVERPDDVHPALLTVLRLVFPLYAEERDLLSEEETCARNYSLAGLYERPARGRGAPFRHDEPALRRVGAVARAVPAVSPRGRGRRAAASAASRGALLTRPVPVPRLPPGGQGALGARARRTAADSRPHRLPPPRQAAGARRQAHLLLRPQCRAHRLALRNLDGVPHSQRVPTVEGLIAAFSPMNGTATCRGRFR